MFDGLLMLEYQKSSTAKPARFTEFTDVVQANPTGYQNAAVQGGAKRFANID